jgi:hypothetical protein
MRRRLATELLGVVGACAILAAAGCSKSGNHASLEALLKQSGDNRASLYPLAGKVTIDGQPAQYAKPQRLVMMLYDPTRPDLPPFKRPCKDISAEGTFAFGTYAKGDGLPAGKFVVTFAVLRVTNQGLLGPDQLNNLYNDPDKNAQNPEFNIVHQAPGKEDYLFDLKVAGQEGVRMPGPNALTELRPQGN